MPAGRFASIVEVVRQQLRDLGADPDTILEPVEERLTIRARTAALPEGTALSVTFTEAALLRDDPRGIAESFVAAFLELRRSPQQRERA